MLSRKFKPELRPSELYSLNQIQLTEAINRLQNFPSKKRFEENMKFVYKVILKKLREKFALENGYELWDKQFERAFYEHYFEETRK